ncbi:MAG TPA: hypothetical protein VF326_12200, partial [Anaerolineaceae bacterium]
GCFAKPHNGSSILFVIRQQVPLGEGQREVFWFWDPVDQSVKTAFHPSHYALYFRLRNFSGCVKKTCHLISEK